MTRRLLVAAALLAVALAACAREDDSTVDTQSPAASASVSLSPAPSSAVPTTSSPSPTFDGTVVDVRYAGGKVEVASREVSVKTGTKIKFVVFTDRNEELHVHGVNLKKDLPAGQTTEFVITAPAPGSYEVELEKSGKQVVELRVSS